ncbi:NADH dehydrogenase subunit G [Leptospira ryugenii]|uniref:NADH dehydrogenase subunit G n=1 Tax=Leptospira ryugenii TaxID=1917863 RepID=A0A2P2E3D0_9LEPT|nr:2Fe-2S iron-sulfur cluster-binding protein [Leptospira ryugenii]GBF51402.1 NADH dehydrogenase subunit G [Leptospira ryugenii]
MVKIKIDGVEFEVDEKKNLIDAAKDVGVEIPYFCYHPALTVVGMCRMCLIEIEGVPRLQAACNTPVKEGMGIITKSDRVKEARAGTMEFLLANHPLDCPVCDKAGECKLQDNAFGSGTGQSRFEFEKRNVPQEEIGTNLIINHNRCIVCYRCVRFEEEKVGESNLGLFERGNHSLIGLAKDEPIQHNFQGALADICPVGALLNHKTLFKSRVWWYKSHKSVCHGCSTGCNVTTNVRDNKMYRYMVRENYEQGMFFLCDKGRFDIDWMNENRLFSFMDSGTTTTSVQVLESIASLVKRSKGIAIIGGAHETNESLSKIKSLLADLSKESNNVNTYFEVRVTDAQYKDTEQEDFLLTKDRHPNTRGALDLGLSLAGGLSEIESKIKEGKIDLVFSIKESIPDQWRASVKQVHLDTNQTPEVNRAQFSVPIKIFAEQVGSFTNKNGLKQDFEKSMEAPQGLPSSAEFFERLLQVMISKKEALIGNR